MVQDGTVAAVAVACLQRDLFTCRRCGRVEGDTSHLHGDHVVAHRGDEALFFDERNVQTLCANCHNSAKQSEEAAARRTGL